MRQRFSTDEIFQRVIASADEEIGAADRELLLSGIAAGFAITLTFLGSAVGTAVSSNEFLEAILYPIGFIYIIPCRRPKAKSSQRLLKKARYRLTCR